MNVFAEYKFFRNKMRSLSIEESLVVIWAYCQYLQMNDFKFPKGIHVSLEFLDMEFPQGYVSEWHLETLAKEIILNGDFTTWAHKTLRDWNTIADVLNSLKDFEDRIYRYHGPKNIFVELNRIAHRQFPWQERVFRQASFIRYFRIFNRPKIDEICKQKIGLGIWHFFMTGFACISNFLQNPVMKLPFTSDIKALPAEMAEEFFKFVSLPIDKLKAKLTLEQQYSSAFPYAYNSLRAYPLVKMKYQGDDAIVCPLLPLLVWRSTTGLYYDLIKELGFAKEFGEGFQVYVGDVIERSRTDALQYLEEREYKVGKNLKKTVDWLVSDKDAALFVECKAKRLTWDAKASIVDLKPLQADIDILADAIIQLYKSVDDYINQRYPHFSAIKDRKIFPLVVTLENWHLFGAYTLEMLSLTVNKKLIESDLAQTVLEQMPYSIMSIEEFEMSMQVIGELGIVEFMDKKIDDEEMKKWGWRSYITTCYPNRLSRTYIFQKEFDDMFEPLFMAQA